MKKTVHTEGFLAILTGLAAIGGAFLRRHQLLYELQDDGSLAEGSTMQLVLPILTAVVLVAMIAMLLPLQKKERWEQVFSPAVAPNFLQLLCAACLVIGSVLQWTAGPHPVTAFATRSPAVSNALSAMLPPLGILAAACIAGFAVLSLLKRKPSALLYMVASVYLVIRLIVRFQEWNTDPSIHDYGFQLLAAICCMLAAFQLAGFSFDRGKRRICLFWALCAVLFCGITMPDALLRGGAGEAFVNAALLLSMAVSSVQLLFGTSRGRKFAIQDNTQ